MGHPYLFDEGRKDGRRRVGADPADERRFRIRSLHEFGMTANWLRTHCDWGIIEPMKMAGFWWDSLAAEAMLYRPEYRQNNPPFMGFVTEDARPGGLGMPAYVAMKRFPAAAALFPLASEGTASPVIARIWAVGADADDCMPPTADTPFNLEGAETILEEAKQHHVRLYADLPQDCQVVGRSWQLAAVLAMDALMANDLDYTIRLASQWILTGEVAGARIEAVGIKNKPLCGLSNKRCWMIPEADENVFINAQRSHNTELPYTTVRTLNDAVEYVSEPRFVRQKDQPWPTTINALHALVGRSLQPVLDILPYTCVQNLYLWPIGGCGNTDTWKCEIIKHYPGIHIHVMPALCADSLADAAAALKRNVASHAGKQEGAFFIASEGVWPIHHVVASYARSCNATVVTCMPETGTCVKIWWHRFVTRYCRLSQHT